ncbi:MAG: hypothetical protein ACJ8R9_21960 [Steroidobacteraceae bacterium]
MARKQQGGRARGKRSTPLQQALPAKAIAIELRSVHIYLGSVRSLLVMAIATLQRQAADNDTDVAAALKQFGVNSISTQMERIEALITGCDKAVARRMTERPAFHIATGINAIKG